MTNLLHWMAAQWAGLGIGGGVGVILGKAFDWWLPSRKELREERKVKLERKIDASVFQVPSTGQGVLKGARPMTGSGSPAIRTDEIAGILKLDHDVVADSLDRLESKGKARCAGGTTDNPSPYWHILYR